MNKDNNDSLINKRYLLVCCCVLFIIIIVGVILKVGRSNSKNVDSTNVVTTNPEELATSSLADDYTEKSDLFEYTMQVLQCEYDGDYSSLELLSLTQRDIVIGSIENYMNTEDKVDLTGIIAPLFDALCNTIYIESIGVANVAGEVDEIEKDVDPITDEFVEVASNSDMIMLSYPRELYACFLNEDNTLKSELDRNELRVELCNYIDYLSYEDSRWFVSEDYLVSSEYKLDFLGNEISIVSMRDSIEGNKLYKIGIESYLEEDNKLEVVCYRGSTMVTLISYLTEDNLLEFEDVSQLIKILTSSVV